MVNEKFRERVPAWNVFQKNPEKFQKFFKTVLRLVLNDQSQDGPNLRENCFLMIFLDHCFTSMEIDLIRDQVT